MPNVLVREVNVAVLDRLKMRARSKGRSLQTEVRLILTEAANEPEQLTALETSRKIRAAFSKNNQSDSVVLLREDRQR